MIANAKRIATLLSHILVAIMVIAVSATTFSIIAGDNRVFWPSLIVKIVGVAALIFVLWLVALAEPDNGDIDNDFSISLYTFTNSVTALAPLISLLVLSLVLNSETSPLLASPIYQILEHLTAQPGVWTFVVGLALLVISLGCASWAARQLSKGRPAGTISSTASIFALCVSSLFVDEWKSATPNLTSIAALFAAVTTPILFWIVSRRLILSLFILREVVRDQQFSATNILSSFRTSIQFIWLVVRHLALKMTINIVVALTVALVLSVSFVFIDPEETIQLVRLHSRALSNTTASLTLSVVLSAILVLFTIIICTFVAKARVAPEKSPRWFKMSLDRAQSIQRALGSLLAISLGLVIAAAAFILVGIVGSLLIRTLLNSSSPPDSSNSEASFSASSEVEHGDTPETEVTGAPEFDIAPLEQLDAIELQMTCRNRRNDFEWSYESDDSVNLNLSNCRLGEPEAYYFDGAILIVGIASPGANVDRENARALNRARNMANWTLLQFQTESRAPDIYILNLGMLRSDNLFRSQQNILSRETERPIKAVFFQPQPDSAISNRASAVKAIRRYVANRIDSNRYSKCELYEYSPYTAFPSQLTRRAEWSCPIR